MQMVPGHTSASWRPPIVVPPRDLLEAAAEILNAGKKIVILAGSGSLGATDELERFADTLGAHHQAALGQGGRSRRFALYNRRHRSLGDAAIRARDGGVRHAFPGRDELSLSQVVSEAGQSQGRPSRQ